MISLKRPWLRRTLFVLLALTLLVVGVLVWARVVANGRLEEELDLVRASGAPLTLASAAPPHVAPEQNAAVLLEEAFALFEDEPFDGEAWEPYERWWLDPYAVDEETAAVIVAWVARNERPLQMVVRALERPECRFNLDWSSAVDMQFPIVGLQQASRLLMSRAVLHARRGGIDEALSSCRDILRLGELGGRDPLLIMLLVRMGIEAVGLETAREALARGTPSAEALKEFAAVVESLPYEGVLTPTFLAERAFGSSWAFSVEEDADAAKAFMVMGFEESAWKETLAWFMGTTMARLDHARYLGLMHRVLALVKRPYRDARADWQAFSTELRDRPWYDRFGAGACSIFNTVALRLATHRTRLDLVRLALAVESFAATEGRLPRSLAELKLESIPSDRLGMGPYTYRALEDGGYLLYSIGPNGVDDNGVEDEDDPEQGDLVWRRAAR